MLGSVYHQDAEVRGWLEAQLAEKKTDPHSGLGKAIAYLIVWKSEPVGKEADPRTLAPFSGQKFSAGSHDDCGRHTYDARPH